MKSTVVDEYIRHSTAFTRVIREVEGWNRDSPCEGWTARDVLRHVIDTQRDFLSGHRVELGTAPDLGDPVGAWTAHDRAVRVALADPGIAEREFAGAFGPTTLGETMGRFYGFDLVAHRWDLARADGREERFTDSELDLLEQSVEGFGEHLYAAGICKPALETGVEADRQERLLALLGRVA